MPDPIDAAIAAAEEAAEARRRALAESERRSGDRSAIAKLIAWAFVILIAGLVLAVTLGTAALGWDRIAEPAKFVMTILSSVMLPVVTLVIGYYFGKEN